jgi:glycine cleavage system H protein
VSLGANALATIGITDYAQKELGDVVYIELPEVGRAFHKDEVVAVVESVKAASDIMTPMSGTVTEANTELEYALILLLLFSLMFSFIRGSPQLLNSSPLQRGWIAKINYSNAAEFDALMTEEQYNSYLTTLAHE